MGINKTLLHLRVQRLDRPELVAYDRILRRYGGGCYLQTTEERENYWRIPFGVHVPSKIVDEKTEREKVLTFNFGNIGEVLVRKSTMRVMKATPLRSLGKHIQYRRTEIGQLVEKDLIKVIGDPRMHIQFSKLRHALYGLEPIHRTLVRLLQEDYPTYEESALVGQHYIEQTSLLLDIGYAEYTPSINDPEARLTATNKLKELYLRERSIEKTIDAVLGMILSEFYYDLQKGMRIFQFIPYVKASTGYYGNAIQFGKLLSISERRLKEITREYYRGVPITRRVSYAYPTIVSELVDAEILDYDGTYVTGREEIFNKLVDIRSELPVSEEPIILS
jgi:hypothetical protein